MLHNLLQAAITSFKTLKAITNVFTMLMDTGLQAGWPLRTWHSTVLMLHSFNQSSPNEVQVGGKTSIICLLLSRLSGSFGRCITLLKCFVTLLLVNCLKIIQKETVQRRYGSLCPVHSFRKSVETAMQDHAK